MRYRLVRADIEGEIDMDLDPGPTTFCCIPRFVPHWYSNRPSQITIYFFHFNPYGVNRLSNPPMPTIISSILEYSRNFFGKPPLTQKTFQCSKKLILSLGGAKIF